jgi:SSS family solute:Na+ symporter
VAAAIVGAIMSTISGLVNSTSTIFTLDIVRRDWGRNWPEERLVRAGRWSGGIALLTGAAFAPIVMRWESIFRYAQDIWAPMAAPVVVVFLCGAFWSGTGRRGAVACLWLAILSAPFTLAKCILADCGIHFLPANLENPLVLAGAVNLISWALMACLTDKRPLRAGLLPAVILGATIVALTARNPSAMVVVMGLTILAGIGLPAMTRTAVVRGLWDQSMLRTDPKAAWHASVWLWWSLYAAAMGGVYWYFW